MMTAIDFRRAALKAKGYFGREKEMLLSWANDNGASATDADKAVLEVLRRNGALSSNLDEAWMETYALSGLTGDEVEMNIAFWRDLGGNLPLTAIVGWTGKEHCLK